MAYEKVPLIGTTNGSGSATITAAYSIEGLLYGLYEDKGTLDNGVDFTLSVVNSEMTLTLLTLTNANTDGATYFPRVATCGNTGSATSQIDAKMPVFGTLQVVIAEGGAAHTGGLYVIIEV